MLEHDVRRRNGKNMPKKPGEMHHVPLCCDSARYGAEHAPFSIAAMLHVHLAYVCVLKILHV